jgi:hypothetical protein
MMRGHLVVVVDIIFSDKLLNLETAVDRLNSLKVLMNKRVWRYFTFTDMVTNATDVIARFLGSLATLLRLAGIGLRRSHLPNEALPANLKNAHSHPFNCRF